jgi:ligand-binding SRPBCC domain-containing protein
MGTHRLEHTQIIPAGLETCWAFFSDPRNLSKITPSELDFQILSELPGEMHAGLKIEYRVRPLLGIPMRWISEITEVQPLRAFADEQRKGPYRTWCHRHEFRPLDAHRTEMRDVVDYSLWFGPLGDLAHFLVVRRQLKHIFDYRTAAVERLFGSV